MQYALRSWNLNKGQGDIKFFEQKGLNQPLDFGKKEQDLNMEKFL